MKRRYVFKCMLTAVLLLVSIGGYADTKEFRFEIKVDGINYICIYYNETGAVTNNGTAAVTCPENDSAGELYSGNIVIPESLEVLGDDGNYYEFIVTEIYGEAVRGSSITSLQLPNTIERIGAYAFSDMKNIKSIKIPSSVTVIERELFYGCDSLESVEIPSSVTSIKERAFGLCYSLREVDIPDGVEYIGEDCFMCCESLLSVHLPSSIKSIEYGTFSYCYSLQNINIPNSVNSIGAYAFANCRSLKSIVIPNSVTNIGAYAFKGTPWYENADDGPFYIAGLLYSYHGVCPQGGIINVREGITTIVPHAFDGCSGLASITLPSSIESIGESAFKDCSGLTSFVIPDSVSKINDETFYGCSGLTSVTIPSSVAEIGSKAFYGCSSLTNLSIPSSITKIGTYAFQNCTSLANAVIGCSETNNVANTRRLVKTVSDEEQTLTINSYAFNGCTNLTEIYSQFTTPPNAAKAFTSEHYSNATLFVPEGTLSAYQAADGWKNFTNIKEINTTGISSIMADERKQIDAIYDLQGRRLNVPKRGLNIINGKKVIITQ